MKQKILNLLKKTAQLKGTEKIQNFLIHLVKNQPQQ